ncbi:MAG: flagella basal body P-ring formation protein FlgA [Candidatus Acidiferrales bacterium]|jgi:flagellar basal body P-ring formation chaperone FlgA
MKPTNATRSAMSTIMTMPGALVRLGLAFLLLSFLSAGASLAQDRIELKQSPSAIANPPQPSRAPRTQHPSGNTQPILVKAGEPVQLFLEGAGMRIATTAIPLTVGREGEQIRVRSILSGKILVGMVVAPQTVRVDYR